MRLPPVSKKSFALISICLLALLSAAAAVIFSRLHNEKALARERAASSSRMRGFPKIFLWAWERPERLEFIDTRAIGVAFLAETLYLGGEEVMERPRMQPLKVPAGTTLIAVVRIETVRNAPPSLSTAQRAEVVASLAKVSRTPNVSALQIDFDARQSERQFYKELLEELRPRLPEAMPLSITALASWCVYDNWLDGLPVDEAVPMLFRMGIDERRIGNYLKEGGAFRSPLCRLSSGVSTDEPVRLINATPRTYIFSPQPWSAESVRSAIERNLNENPNP